MSREVRFERALVVADGRVDDARLRLEAARPGTLVIGADGGAARAMHAGCDVDVVVGDLDSIDPAALVRLETTGTQVQRAHPDKDESDTELALLVAVDRGLDPIVVMGALGGPRLDHELANLLLLTHPRLDGRDVSIVDGPTTVRRMGTVDEPGRLDIEGAPGDVLTLLPIAGPVSGVTTRELRYPLHGEDLVPGPARGLSNELLGSNASVITTRGRLLVIHTRLSTTEAAS
jgi:thiamine pyrophosphokinase